MQRALITCTTYSRTLLILGLVLGIGLPGLAAAMAPFLPEMVAILLVITAFRIGIKDVFGALGDLRWSLPAVVVLQVMLPLTVAAVFGAIGSAQTPLALAMVLAVAAPTISGGASLAIVMRQDPARMVQILVLGTALFPVTSLIVLTIFPVAISVDQLVWVGLRTLGTIIGATAVGFALRTWLLPHPTAEQARAVEGAAILFFAVIVIGLMTALGPVLATDPGAALIWILAAFGLCFGLQMLSLVILSKGPLAPVAGPLALASGNRNIALFLVALPQDIMAPIMIFIACWQIPMYLTPIFLPRLYAQLPAHD